MQVHGFSWLARSVGGDRLVASISKDCLREKKKIGSELPGELKCTREISLGG